MHFCILVEKMRREGYEMPLTPPQVIFKEENGEKLEPIEGVTIELGNEHLNVIMDEIQNRKGLLISSDDVDNLRINVTF